MTVNHGHGTTPVCPECGSPLPFTITQATVPVEFLTFCSGCEPGCFAGDGWKALIEVCNEAFLRGLMSYSEVEFQHEHERRVAAEAEADKWNEIAFVAVARAEAAEAERDEWKASFKQAAERGDAAHNRREAAEAERDELAKSLRDIVCIYDSPVGDPVEVMQVMVGIARSALIAERERRIPTGDGSPADREVSP